MALIGYYVGGNCIQAYAAYGGQSYAWMGDHSDTTLGQVVDFTATRDQFNLLAVDVNIHAGQIEPVIYPNGYATPTVNPA